MCNIYRGVLNRGQYLIPMICAYIYVYNVVLRPTWGIDITKLIDQLWEEQQHHESRAVAKSGYNREEGALHSVCLNVSHPTAMEVYMFPTKSVAGYQL